MDYILSKQLKPCMVCGKLTNQIEACSEGYLCSGECNKKWYQDYFERICKSCGKVLAIEKR